MKYEAELELEKETKNTYRYMAVASGQPPAVTTIYVAKWLLGTNPPKKIKLTIEAE